MGSGSSHSRYTRAPSRRSPCPSTWCTMREKARSSVRDDDPRTSGMKSHSVIELGRKRSQSMRRPR